MGKLIKKIKIKKQDGTFTDYIPIGAEAKNIETNDGESVQLKLNKKPYYYKTVADMKADTKLKSEDTVITLGYYSANDGGGATYKITDTESQTEYQEEVGDLYATLIVENEVNVKQFGAYGDGTHDDSTIINTALNFAFTNDKNIYIPEGTFLITNTLIVKGNKSSLYPATIIKGAGRSKTTLKSYNNSTNIMEITPISDETTACQLFMSDFTIDGDNSSVNGIEIKGTNFTHSRLENIKIIYCTNAGITNENDKTSTYLDQFVKLLVMYCGTGIKLQNGINTSLRIADCYVYGCENGYGIKGSYCTMENCCADAITGSVFGFTEFTGTCISPGSESPDASTVFDLNKANITIINPFTYGNLTDANAVHIKALTGSHVEFINGFILVNPSTSTVDGTALGKLYQLGQESILSFDGTRYSNYSTNNSYSQTRNYMTTNNEKGIITQRYGNQIAFIGRDTRFTNHKADERNLSSTILANAIFFGLGDSTRYDANGTDFGSLTFNTQGDILLSRNPANIGGIGWIQSQQPTTGGNWRSGKYLKIPVIHSGATTDRPSVSLEIGQMFFDTTLGKPIWYNGSNWVDATGTQV